MEAGVFSKWLYDLAKDQINISEIIGEGSFHVYSYLGSLTIPNCNEVVTLMVN